MAEIETTTTTTPPPTEFIKIIETLSTTSNKDDKENKRVNREYVQRFILMRDKNPEKVSQWLLFIITDLQFTKRLKIQSLKTFVGGIQDNSWKRVSPTTKKKLKQVLIKDVLKFSIDTDDDFAIIYFMFKAHRDLGTWKELPTLLVNATTKDENENCRVNAFTILEYLWKDIEDEENIPKRKESQMFVKALGVGLHDKSERVRKAALSAAITLTKKSPYGHQDIFWTLVPFFISVLYDEVTSNSEFSETILMILLTSAYKHSPQWLKTDADHVLDILLNILKDAKEIEFNLLESIFGLIQLTMRTNQNIWKSEQKKGDIERLVVMIYKWAAKTLRESDVEDWKYKTEEEFEEEEEEPFESLLSVFGLSFLKCAILGPNLLVPIMMNHINTILSDSNSDWSMKAVALRSFKKIINIDVPPNYYTPSFIESIISSSKTDHLPLKYYSIDTFGFISDNFPNTAQNYIDLIVPTIEYYTQDPNLVVQLPAVQILGKYLHLIKNIDPYKTSIINTITTVCQSQHIQVLEEMADYVSDLVSYGFDSKLFLPLLKAHDEGNIILEQTTIDEIKQSIGIQESMIVSSQSTTSSVSLRKKKQTKQQIQKQLQLEQELQQQQQQNHSTESMETSISTTTDATTSSHGSRISFLGHIVSKK